MLEELPTYDIKELFEDCKDSDLLLVLGTLLNAVPFVTDLSDCWKDLMQVKPGMIFEILNEPGRFQKKFIHQNNSVICLKRNLSLLKEGTITTPEIAKLYHTLYKEL